MNSNQPPQAAQLVTRVVNIGLVVVLLLAVGALILSQVAGRWSRQDGVAVVPLNLPGMEEGDRAFERGQWDAAVGYYRAVVEQDPYQGLAWFRLGYSLHALHRLEEAVEAHQRAAQFAPLRGTALYNLSCAYALQGQHEQSLKALQDAVDAGFRSALRVQDDPDFADLRDNPRFVELAEKATRTDAPWREFQAAPDPRMDPALPADWQPPAEVVAP